MKGKNEGSQDIQKERIKDTRDNGKLERRWRKK